MSQNGHFLIASYPKSGNTWVRCLIASLHSGGKAPDINDLASLCPLASSRKWLENLVGIPTGELTAEEILEARNEAYLLAARTATGPLYLKTHDAWSARLFPPQATRGIVHIVRDPRDIAPSFAHHGQIGLDTMIGQMECEGLVVSRSLRKWRAQADQAVGSWSEHVQSWFGQTNSPRLLLRYEDMRADPVGQTTRLSDFLGLGCDSGLIERTVAACDFRLLQAMERQSGFSEKPPKSERFFRQGMADAWRGALTPEQAGRIAAGHRTVMTALGYDTQAGSPAG